MFTYSFNEATSEDEERNSHLRLVITISESEVNDESNVPPSLPELLQHLSRSEPVVEGREATMSHRPPQP